MIRFTLFNPPKINGEAVRRSRLFINNFNFMSEMTFTDANFEAEALKSDQVVLVDFFATWCGPCKMQGPIIEELAKEIGAKAKVGAMDVDANPETAGKYNIMSVPTLIIFKGGEIKSTMMGLQGKEQLKAEIEKYV